MRAFKQVLHRVGIEVRRVGRQEQGCEAAFEGVDTWVAEITQKVRPFTMTSIERISALCQAIRYVARGQIPGDIVECGVWRGGSMMAAAMTLLIEEDTSRTLFLYDTFEGMPPPTEIDRATKSGEPAALLLQVADQSSNIRAYASLTEVSNNLASTQYPADRIRFIKGNVEHTIPNVLPEQIAVLRLDTDWYTSTKHELTHLFPKLSVGGVLIIDDYGFWDGARRAVDEYIDDNRLRVLLQRIDSTGRLAVKTEPRPTA
jgi:O-methyltransferase